MSDALERLMQRSRPTVPSRDVSLTSTNSQSVHPDISTSRYLDPSVSTFQLTQNANISDIPTSSSLEREDLTTEQSSGVIAANLQAPEPPKLQKRALQEVEEPLRTKQSTLRLEQTVSERLQVVCRSQGICREVLIEAMFEYCENDKAVLQKVFVEAKVKNERRQQLANWKRAQSMMQRFGQAE